MHAVKQTEQPWASLAEQLTQQLASITSSGEASTINKAKKAVLACKQIMHTLQKFIQHYNFESKEQEIHFFKEIKPMFYKELLYYQKIYHLELGRPVGNKNEQQTYFLKELNRINEFFEDNKFFYQYFRSGETYLDEKLFLRNKQDTTLSLQLYDTQSDPAFSTSYDYILSRIMTNETLMEYINSALAQLEGQPGTGKKDAGYQGKLLRWTESKAALIELIYALKAKGSLDSGHATLKDITDLLQRAFNIEVTNPSRDFQEILRRKKGYTIFLDDLKESYLKYIDAIETKA